jgi:hypothetical protein
MTGTSWTVVVVYCDGSSTMHHNNKSHQPNPIAAYRRLEDGTWAPIHTAMFRGGDFTPRSGLQHFSGDEPLGEHVVIGDQFDRSRYVWDCDQCAINEKRSDARLIHKIFDHVATWDDREISLAQLLYALDTRARRNR